MRLLMIIGLGMTLAVTSACQKSGKRRAKFKTGAQSEEKPSARAEAINQMVGDQGKCLKVDKLIAALMTTPDETYLLYTSDSNFFEKGSQEPLLEILTGRNLLKDSDRAYYLSLNAIDDKCEKVSLPNNGTNRPGVYVVINGTNKNKLVLQNTADANEIITYDYNRKNNLTITVQTASSLTCGGKLPLKRTWTLAFAEGLERMNVSKDMMNLFSKNIQLPTEAHRATFTGKVNQTRVHLSYPSFLKMAEAVKAATKENAICPK